MVTTLNKTPNTKGIASDTKFWFSLPNEAIDLIGNRTIIRRHPITKAFVLSKPNLDSHIRSTVISISRALRIPVGMVEEHEDLGEYAVDIDYETETVNLIKK